MNDDMDFFAEVKKARHENADVFTIEMSRADVQKLGSVCPNDPAEVDPDEWEKLELMLDSAQGSAQSQPSYLLIKIVD